MKNYSIAKSRRLRSTPYTSRIENQGVTAYTVYNHMLLPAAFGSIEDSCEHLKKEVQIWDVAAERQVEILTGPFGPGSNIERNNVNYERNCVIGDASQCEYADFHFEKERWAYTGHLGIRFRWSPE